eukprot:TRINITY_DN3645_c0_g1_i1.p1 TRINITY_DN3645_c0_g1~~TRINITY_DN3645_c0_g1_i1.p1  ORF type:complete len:257 (-),score=26.96 TRINITY_DN3645_c0_g1_i1:511-1221(-)
MCIRDRQISYRMDNRIAAITTSICICVYLIDAGERSDVDRSICALLHSQSVQRPSCSPKNEKQISLTQFTNPPTILLIQHQHMQPVVHTPRRIPARRRPPSRCKLRLRNFRFSLEVIAAGVLLGATALLFATQEQLCGQREQYWTMLKAGFTTAIFLYFNFKLFLQSFLNSTHASSRTTTGPHPEIGFVQRGLCIQGACQLCEKARRLLLLHEDPKICFRILESSLDGYWCANAFT